MENNNTTTFLELLSLIKEGKLSELEAERLLNAYSRTLAQTPTSHK